MRVSRLRRLLEKQPTSQTRQSGDESAYGCLRLHDDRLVVVRLHDGVSILVHGDVASSVR